MKMLNDVKEASAALWGHARWPFVIATVAYGLIDIVLFSLPQWRALGPITRDIASAALLIGYGVAINALGRTALAKERYVRYAASEWAAADCDRRLQLARTYRSEGWIGMRDAVIARNLGITVSAFREYAYDRPLTAEEMDTARRDGDRLVRLTWQLVLVTTGKAAAFVWLIALCLSDTSTESVLAGSFPDVARTVVLLPVALLLADTLRLIGIAIADLRTTREYSVDRVRATACLLDRGALL